MSIPDHLGLRAQELLVKQCFFSLEIIVIIFILLTA